MMQGADPARQDLIAYVRERGGLEPAREGVRVRKVEHRLWQVGIGVPMFRHRAADRGEDAPKIEQVERAQRREAWCGEFEHHEAGAGPEHAVRDRKSTRLNSSHSQISYAVFCLKKKKKHHNQLHPHYEFHVLQPKNIRSYMLSLQSVISRLWPTSATPIYIVWLTSSDCALPAE